MYKTRTCHSAYKVKLEKRSGAVITIVLSEKLNDAAITTTRQILLP